MAKFRVGIIGCGRPWKSEGATGFGMAHLHAAGYEASPDAEIVAVADTDAGRLAAFCAEHNVPRGYLSADELFAKESLDIVSICLWPHLHAPMTLKAIEAGVKAIHCEKPMALTFGEAKRMVAAASKRGVQLTFNHMRRFGPPFRKAKALLDGGAIGRLERIEAFTANLYDWGTHWFDMMFFYNDEMPVEWVMGQIDARGGHPIFGAMVEGQGLSFFKWRNGVAGLMATAEQGLFTRDEPLGSVQCGNRLVGSEGIIEVGVSGGPDLRMRNLASGGAWQEIAVEGGMHGSELHAAGVLDLIDALKTGREPELSARKAFQATELIFATYESSRRRARVELPLDIEDSPFLTMLDEAVMTTWPAREVTANGIRLHYHRTGGAKPPLVLCHGFSDNGLCWTPLARALERDYDIIMVDARGHGLSDAPDHGYATENRADDLAGLIQALGLVKPAVLGHSMGASTAARAAAKYPQLIGALLLEDPGWWDESSPRRRPAPEDREAWQQERRRNILEQKSKSREALMALCREQSPGWSEAEIGPWALSKQQLSPNVTNDMMMGDMPWREVAVKFECPTLLLTANPEKGAIVTAAMAAVAQEINPRIETVHIPEAGHCIRRDAFEQYLAAVSSFLDSHKVPG